MKLRFISAALPLMLGGLLHAAPVSEDPITTITTNLGRSYQNCRVRQVDPDGVIFVHQKGIAKVLFDEIPEPLRGKLGFDAQKAADYVKDQAEKKRRALELRAELQKEMIKAQAAMGVAEMEAAGMAMGSYGGMGAAAWGYPGLTGGLYGWDGSLYNGDYYGGYNGHSRGLGWKGLNCFNQNVTRLRYNANCGTPALGVFATNRGLGSAVCPPVRNNFFAVPPVGITHPAPAIHVGGGGLRK